MKILGQARSFVQNYKKKNPLKTNNKGAETFHQVLQVAIVYKYPISEFIQCKFTHCYVIYFCGAEAQH